MAQLISGHKLAVLQFDNGLQAEAFEDLEALFRYVAHHTVLKYGRDMADVWLRLVVSEIDDDYDAKAMEYSGEDKE